MHPRHIASLTLVLTLVLTMSWSSLALAQRSSLAPQQIKLNELIQDTQKSTINPSDVEIVWWVPPEYWAAALSQQEEVPEATRGEFQAIFSEYNVIAVVQAAIGDGTFNNFTSEEKVRRTIRLTDMQGDSHEAIDTDDLPPKLAGTLAYLKPVLASVMGPMGKNMHFVVFPGKNRQGNRLINPLTDGRMQVKTQANTYSFRLPLGSLLPAQMDAKSGESFPGDYLYNPYTGTALETAKKQ